MRLLGFLFTALIAAASFAQNGFTGVPWRTLQSGAYSNTSKSFSTLLTSDGDFQTYHRKNFRGAAPLANFNWNESSILAIHLGQRASSGYRVSVSKAEQGRSGSITVTAVETPPTPGAFVADVITSPWVWVRLDRTIRDVNVRWTKEDPPGYNVYGGVGGIEPINTGYWGKRADINWRSFDFGTQSKADKALMIVMRTDQDFHSYAKRFLGMADDAIPANVNWNQEMLIAVHSGTRRTTGYRIRIEGIYEGRGGSLTLVAKESIPAPGEFVGMSLTSPWVVIRVNRTLRNFELKWDLRERY